MHITITRIIRIKFQPLKDGRTGFVFLRSCKHETELPWCLGWWMSGDSKLNYAWWCSKFQLPLMMLTWTVLESTRQWWFLATIQLQKAYGWWNNEEQCKFYEIFCRKMERKSLCNFVFWSRSGANGMLMMNSVRIIVIYGALIISLISISQMQCV